MESEICEDDFANIQTNLKKKWSVGGGKKHHILSNLRYIIPKELRHIMKYKPVVKKFTL